MKMQLISMCWYYIQQFYCNSFISSNSFLLVFGDSYIQDHVVCEQRLVYFFVFDMDTFYLFFCLIALAAAAAKSLQSCLTLCDPIDGSPAGSPVLGFSRQEHWNGLPLPSPMHESEK